MTNLPLLLSASRILLGPVYALALWSVRDSIAVGPAAVAATAAQRGAAVAGAGIALALPLVVAALASVTDFADGRLARRLGTGSPAGAVLDVVADAVFLLCALAALAAAGLVPWFLPTAAAASLSALALDWRRRPPGARTGTETRTLADRLGHLAGVLNFAVVLTASGVPLGLFPRAWLRVACAIAAGLNLVPIALRWRERRQSLSSARRRAVALGKPPRRRT